jgi:hypothetical protein
MVKPQDFRNESIRFSVYVKKKSKPHFVRFFCTISIEEVQLVSDFKKIWIL